MLDPALEAEGFGRSSFSDALAEDWARLSPEVADQLRRASVLLVGAAGTIGAATARQLLALAPTRLELIDIDENGLARLARDIRSRDIAGATRVGFNTLGFGSPPGLAFLAAAGPFDLVLNFAAVKHVRSEKNVHTLLHMIAVNVLAQQRFAGRLAADRLAGRYFVVSTDKAADPASFMGASKRLMEAVVLGEPDHPSALRTSAARFANVAYSSGSLLESYLQRFAADQALAAPKDTRRYFISARDAARICLLAQHACPPSRIAIPRFGGAAEAVELMETAAAFLQARGRHAVFVEDPAEAGALEGQRGPDYPVLLTPRDTAGEKEIEVFRGEGEAVEDIGLASLEAVRPAPLEAAQLDRALAALARLCSEVEPVASLGDVERILTGVLPNFHHAAATASLDDRI